MKFEKNLELLKEVGLSQDEATVYLAALEMGKTTILKISRATGLKRSTIYNIVESLQKKGLMSIGLQGLKNIYVAESPERLKNTLERKVASLSSQLPELMGLYDLKAGGSLIKYYTGLEALKQIYTDTLGNLKKGEDYLVITNQEKWYNLDPRFALAYIEKRAKLNIAIRLLFQDSPLAREHKKFEKNFNEQIRILPTETALNVDTILLPRRLIVSDLSRPYLTVVIENKSIIEMHRQMFELIWKSLS